MPGMKILHIAAFLLFPFAAVFAAEGTDLKISLNKPKAPQQIFTLKVVQADKNLQGVRLNTHAFESRFFLTMRWENQNGKCAGMRSFNFFDIGKLRPKYKNYVADPKKGANVELKLLSKMAASYINGLKLDFGDLKRMGFSLSLRHLTPKTQDGETEYNTNEIFLDAEELMAFLDAHKKN